MNVSGDPGSADPVQCGAGTDTLTSDADDLATDCESVVVVDAGGNGGADSGGAAAGGGDAAASAAAQPTAPDTTGPAVAVSSRSRAIAARNGRFGLRVGPFAEDVTGVVAARARRKPTRRVLKLGPRWFQARAGERLVVRFRLSRKGRRILAIRGKIRMVATVTARDALGNAATRSFAFTLRAPG